MLDRCGTVWYYVQEADEQIHRTSETSSRASKQRCKGKFSLRDCVQISTPKRELGVKFYYLHSSFGHRSNMLHSIAHSEPQFDSVCVVASRACHRACNAGESGVFELHLQTKKSSASSTDPQIESKTLTLRVEER